MNIEDIIVIIVPLLIGILLWVIMFINRIVSNIESEIQSLRDDYTQNKQILEEIQKGTVNDITRISERIELVITEIRSLRELFSIRFKNE